MEKLSHSRNKQLWEHFNAPALPYTRLLLSTIFDLFLVIRCTSRLFLEIFSFSPLIFLQLSMKRTIPSMIIILVPSNCN